MSYLTRVYPLGTVYGIVEKEPSRYWRRRQEQERRIYNRFCAGKRGVGMVLTKRLREDLERRMARRGGVPIGVRLPVTP